MKDSRRSLLVLGSVSLAVYAGLGWLATFFALTEDGVWGGATLNALLAVMFALLVLSAIYFLAARVCWREATPQLGLIIAFAVAFRLLLVWTPPIAEDDAYRYLWDGKSIVSGVNPFALSPQQVAEDDSSVFDAGKREAHSKLQQLAAASPANKIIFDSINNKSVPTIYPPAAQAMFALSQAVTPASASVQTHLIIWRVAMLAFDVGIIFLLAKILAAAGLSPNLVIVWAWCPIVVKEFANSGHVDAVAVFFCALAFWWLVKNRPALSAVALGVAILTKLYPLVLLVPILFYLGAPKKFAPWRYAAITAGVVALGFLPFVLLPPADGLFEGLRTYGRRWEMNDALFLIPLKMTEWLGWGAEKARWLAGGAFLAVLGWVTARYARPTSTAQELGHGFFLALAWLFLLSPTGFPWYFTWAIFFLPFARSRAWYLLVAFLSCYYLRFWLIHAFGRDTVIFPNTNAVHFFDHYVVWLEFGAPLLLLAITCWRERTRRSVAVGSNAVSTA